MHEKLYIHPLTKRDPIFCFTRSNRITFCTWHMLKRALSYQFLQLYIVQVNQSRILGILHSDAVLNACIIIIFLN